MKPRLRATIVGVCIVLSGTGAAFAQSSDCPSLPPLMTFRLKPIYNSAVDPSNSVVDKSAEEFNAAQLAQLNDFMTLIEKALDTPEIQMGDPRTECAYANFKAWAKAGALTIDAVPYDGVGEWKRAEYIAGIDILALKFRDLGYELDNDIRRWLRALNYKTINMYRKPGQHQNNKRVWAGASIALYALLEPRDSQAVRMQDVIWRDTIAAIGEHGAIASELQRGHRALIYTMYSFSATLVFRSAREAMGRPITDQENDKIHRLSKMISYYLCHPEKLQAAAGAKQEIPGDWAYRQVLGLGKDMLDEDNWRNCGQLNAHTIDTIFGGDTKHTAAVLQRIAQNRR